MKLAIVTNGKSGLYSDKNEVQLVDLDTGQRVPFVSNLKWEIDAELNVPLVTLEMRCVEFIVTDHPNQFAENIASQKRDLAMEDMKKRTDALKAWHKDFEQRSEEGLEELELDERTTTKTESVDKAWSFRQWLNKKL